MSCILVIHQSLEIRLSLSFVLSAQGYDVLEASDISYARSVLDTNLIKLVILDIDECKHTGVAKNTYAFVDEVKTRYVDIAFLAITQWQTPLLIQQSTQAGISAFIAKPWKNLQLIQAVQQQLEQTRLLHKYHKLHDYFIGKPESYYAWQSHSMQKIFRQINSLNVKLPFYVISGAKSTGKKTLARYIHENASRAQELLLTLDCATFAEEGDEPWLAPMNFIGSGSLVLENLEQLSIPLQEKLVSYLFKQKRSDGLQGCIVLLCNKKLSELTEVKNNKATNLSDKYLLPELYKLMKINEIHLPPLNQRKDDIVPLMQYMLAQKNVQTSLSEDAKQTLQAHDWPLNLKELALAVDHIIALNINPITATDLKFSRLNSNTENIALPMITLEEAEIALLKQALQVTENNIPKAAVLLGLTKSSMYRRVEKYALVKK